RGTSTRRPPSRRSGSGRCPRASSIHWTPRGGAGRATFRYPAPVPALERREIELDGRRVSYMLRRSARARYLRADIGLRTGLRVTLPDGLNQARMEAVFRSRRG